MKGIILLEGADGTGKTTLALELVAKYDAHYIHNSLYPDMWAAHLDCVREAVRESATRLVVIDRLWISEQIYGAVFRGGPAYDLGARCLDRVLQRFATLTILCVREDLQKHMAHFEELKTTREEKFTAMHAVATRYLDLYRGNLAYGAKGRTYTDQLTCFQDFGNRMDVMGYDMDLYHNKAASFVGLIGDRLMAMQRDWRQEPKALDPSNSNLAGSFITAKHLFVGEQLSPRAECYWPFVWNDEPSAASWLNQALHTLAYNETSGLWTNAIGSDSFLKEVFARRPDIRVVPFGNIAINCIGKLGFRNVRPMVHPQWARRFQHGEPDIFRNALRDALS